MLCGRFFFIFCSDWYGGNNCFSLQMRPGILFRSLAVSQLVTFNIFNITFCQQSSSTLYSPINLKQFNSMMSSMANLKYLTAAESQSIDEELFSTGGFSVDQLMELAGLSVAQAVHAEYGHVCGARSEKIKVLVLCGPGNNGGDGLVAARHLNHFGMSCSVHYPKQSTKDLFVRLVTQAKQAQVDFIETLPDTLNEFDIVIDALFGFSFKGQPRPPFDSILKTLKHCEGSGHSRIVSVDIPSGWNVDTGPRTA
ncbi:NAD(P)H-hydrate epimerase-like isoform X2 [Convolutriloba macropyga]|uniref:NAD(P)H-hydrate epimerase-like isoform X2 n=1 Tax=Convolutriloba macropyga TaxID=536237 RepID=UPI003F5251F3